jgi:hypothetical protein
MAEDDAQHIIEIMGDTSCKPSYRFQLLSLVELAFKFNLLRLSFLAFGDVGEDTGKLVGVGSK